MAEGVSVPNIRILYILQLHAPSPFAIPAIHDHTKTPMTSLAERYLTRIGLTKPERLDLAALSTILQAHLRAIPFENVTSFTGTPVSLNPEDVFSKLLEGRRGGYCMEHAFLSRSALSALGFKVEPILARVYFGRDNEPALAQTHGATVVHFDDGEYVFDPGFGRYTPSIPVCLTGGPDAQVGQYGTYRVRPGAEVRSTMGDAQVGEDVVLVLESLLGDHWAPLYGYTRRPVVAADIIAFNWFISTYPDGLFVTNIMCATWDGDSRVTCFGKHFKKISEEGSVEADVGSSEDVRHWLCTEMGLELDDKLVDAVWERLNAV